jgi:hypothetical protein
MLIRLSSGQIFRFHTHILIPSNFNCGTRGARGIIPFYSNLNRAWSRHSGSGHQTSWRKTTHSQLVSSLVLNDALLNADVDDNLDVINDDIVRSKIIFLRGPVHARSHGSGNTVGRVKWGARDIQPRWATGVEPQGLRWAAKFLWEIGYYHL